MGAAHVPPSLLHPQCPARGVGDKLTTIVTGLPVSPPFRDRDQHGAPPRASMKRLAVERNEGEVREALWEEGGQRSLGTYQGATGC